jgi:hypothetical protein
MAWTGRNRTEATQTLGVGVRTGHCADPIAPACQKISADSDQRVGADYGLTLWV